MAIFITIIKLILVVLLVLVALVLISAGLILFVPVRYHIDGSFRDETLAASAEARWLLGALSARAGYNRDDGAVAYIKVCGFKVYDILGGDKDAEDNAQDADGEDTEICESYVNATDGLGEDADKTSVGTDAKTDSDKYIANGIGDTSKVSTVPESESADAASPCYNSCEHEHDSLTGEKSAQQGSTRPKVQVYKSHGIPTRWYERLLELIAKSLPWITAPLRYASIFLRGIADRISSFIDSAEEKLRNIWQSIKVTAIAMKAAFDKRSTQVRKLQALWEDKRFAKGKALLIERIKKLSSELSPRAGSGRVRIGRDDPFETGQMMQLAAFLYPLYGDRVEVVPDFDETILEGEIDLRGRLKLIVAAEAAFRLFFNRELRAMYHRARHILELE